MKTSAVFVAAYVTAMLPACVVGWLTPELVGVPWWNSWTANVYVWFGSLAFAHWVTRAYESSDNDSVVDSSHVSDVVVRFKVRSRDRHEISDMDARFEEVQ